MDKENQPRTFDDYGLESGDFDLSSVGV